MARDHELTRRELMARSAAAAAALSLAACGETAGGAGAGGRGADAGGPSAGESGVAGHAGAAADRPDILFVLSDSHRASAMGVARGAREDVATPHFDAFARQGVQLASAVSSTPLCRPFRASWMSGCFSHRTGLLTNNAYERNFGIGARGQWEPGRLGLPTLGRTLREAGYWCGYIGKWHLGEVALAPGDPRRLGFDDVWTASVRTPRGEQDQAAHDYWNWRYATGEEAALEGGGRFRAEVETDWVLEALGERARERARARTRGEPAQPWFLTLAWGPPHDPFTPPPDFVPRGRLTLPPNLPDLPGIEAVREQIPRYYGLVSAIDASFGRLLEGLEALGLGERTLVVYTSDHGIMLGSHGWSGKERPWSASTGVPLLLRWPAGLAGGRVLDLPFGTPDILPTLCGLAGVAPPGGIDGRDLSPALRGEPGAGAPDAALLQCLHSSTAAYPGWRGLRTARHLYARRREEPMLLYDLQSDPWELENLVAADPALLEAMDARLAGLMETAGDRWEL